MILLNRPIQVSPALLARVAENRGVLVHNLELVAVLGYLDIAVGNDSDLGEQRALRPPTLGATTEMLVQNIAFEFNLDGVALAEAVEGAPLEVRVAFNEAVIDDGVEGDGHFGTRGC